MSKYAACAQKYKIQPNGCRGASVPCTKYAACAQKWAAHGRAEADTNARFWIPGHRVSEETLGTGARRRPGEGGGQEKARRSHLDVEVRSLRTKVHNTAKRLQSGVGTMHEVRSLRTKMGRTPEGTAKAQARLWIPGHRVSEES